MRSPGVEAALVPVGEAGAFLVEALLHLVRDVHNIFKGDRGALCGNLPLDPFVDHIRRLEIEKHGEGCAL